MVEVQLKKRDEGRFAGEGWDGLKGVLARRSSGVVLKLGPARVTCGLRRRSIVHNTIEKI